MFNREDNTYNEIREKSLFQWLDEMEKHEDIAVRGGVKDVHNNILQGIETHMYEQAFSPDKENDERSFDEICDEALKLFKSQCDNIHFKAIDDRDVELISDDNGHNKYNVIIIEHFRLLQSRHTTYKSMSQELYKYCVQYLHDMAKNMDM